MYTLLHDIAALIADAPIALARVVATSGAGPRSVGASMLITAEGRPLGSLSAGCVESVVIHTALEVISTGRATSERFGYSDPDAIEVGLSCGGEIEVFIERLDAGHREWVSELIAAREAGRRVAVATTLDEDPHHRIVDDRTETVVVELEGGQAFVHTYSPPPRMVLAGANDYVRALGAMATVLGYRVTVVDARPVFATRDRFPEVHEVVVDWPHRYLRGERAAGRLDSRTVVCVMTHDTKFDVPTLEAALAMKDLAFVGALGSRRTHEDRLERLRAAVHSEEALRRVQSPLGLDLDAQSPEETAVSILAQVIADRTGASGQRLRDLQGPIHRQRLFTG
ncbi:MULTISPECIES: XdhC family protein [unclassified Rhodococcus (in: high G+C Gram-positive bacteria)]|uniref:XdhC family protein n=1 Tax=unclassified Rhodococcus (in: high G+C Gram-positive bacteria) TaxID=192944 RepID=UPI0006F20764|nr:MULTISPECIES: XdhC family protein [unclassified Rhodococcus (in: high G+C Gram-positive bacteria)]KQU28513.1 XshC-Cox1 family protein [Rhodococcus sp. Leaf225]KQU44439.1 XshC-Cox1 family protein [Rhodococcus sp. Leaf258]